MGILSKAVKATMVGAAATTGTFFLMTRKSIFVPVSPNTDPIFQSSFYTRFNPNQNPTTHDLCVRKVPLSKIKPSLQREDGRLVEAFGAGVWSGLGTFLTLSRLLADSHAQQGTPINVATCSRSTMAHRLSTSSGPRSI